MTFHVNLNFYLTIMSFLSFWQLVSHNFDLLSLLFVVIMI